MVLLLTMSDSRTYGRLTLRVVGCIEGRFWSWSICHAAVILNVTYCDPKPLQALENELSTGQAFLESIHDRSREAAEQGRNAQDSA